MKKRILQSILLLFAATMLHAEQAALVVSADGSETTYALSTVQVITFADGETPSMTVSFNNGTDSITGVSKIAFSVMQSGDTPTALEDLHQSKIYIFPNPVSDYLQIGGVEAAESIIYDIQGRKVSTSTDLQIPVGNLPEGIYFLQVNHEQTIRFIKK